MTHPSATQTGTRLTTLCGGCGITAYALLSMAIGLPFVTVNGATSLSWYSVPSLVSVLISFVAALILAGAVYCLGFGIRGESGLVGDHVSGRIAAGAFVVASVVNSLIQLISWFAPTTIGSAEWRGYVQVGLGAVTLASVIVAVIVVVLRRNLNRALRWGLVIVAAWTLFTQAIWYLPLVGTEPDATMTTFLIFASNSYPVGLLLQALLGVSIALDGQALALRRLAAAFNERW